MKMMLGRKPLAMRKQGEELTQREIVVKVCVCVCVRARVRACVRASERACVRARVCVCCVGQLAQTKE